MRVYYEDAHATIYHGATDDVIDQWCGLRTKSFDLLLTDPPYGIGSWSATGGNSLRADEIAGINAWDVAPDPALLVACINLAKYSIVWGGNYLGSTLGRTRAPLIWDKGIRGMHFADGEMAWTNFDFGTLRIFNMPVGRGDTKGHRLHPTQKPEALMLWSLQMAHKASGPVLDPFMGSGTTLVACKRLGRRCVGIERDEKYCEIAASRLSQGSLFAEIATPSADTEAPPNVETMRW